jgi:DNA-binding Xre family transcriptional regulator
MMNTFSTQNLRRDSKLLSNTLLRLALPRIITRLVILAVVVALWFSVCRFTLDKGAMVRYNGFEAFGPQVVDFLTRMNPYIWWVVVLIISLCVIAGLRNWLHSSLARGRAALVPLDVFRRLCASLSPEVLDVLRWVWKDPEVPVTTGNLHSTLKQIRSGRVRKMALARAQKAELNLATQPKSDTQTTPADSSGYREPTLMA